MFGTVLVPLDGSAESARALVPAARIARALDSPLETLTLADNGNSGSLREAIEDQTTELEVPELRITVEKRCAFVAEQLESHVAEQPNALVVMSTHGRGRSAAVVGSVAEELERLRSGPIVLVGPNCDLERYRPGATMLVPLDGTDESERVVSVASAFAIVMHHPLVFVTVESDAAGRSDAQVRVQAAAEEATTLTHGQQTFEVLHGRHVGPALSMRANDPDVGLIGMATHGRQGFERIRSGSVTATVVADASCPVLVMRTFTP